MLSSLNGNKKTVPLPSSLSNSAGTSHETSAGKIQAGDSRILNQHNQFNYRSYKLVPKSSSLSISPYRNYKSVLETIPSKDTSNQTIPDIKCLNELGIDKKLILLQQQQQHIPNNLRLNAVDVIISNGRLYIFMTK
jgi:hypothetical protein